MKDQRETEIDGSSLKESLKDSATVHMNILRGDIALTTAQAIHIAGLPADIEQRMDKLQQCNAMLVTALKNYMSQIGQGFVAHDLPFTSFQSEADSNARAALAAAKELDLR